MPMYLCFVDLFLRLAREARAARPRPLEREFFLVGVVLTCEEGERGVVWVVTGESGEEEETVLDVTVCCGVVVVLGTYTENKMCPFMIGVSISEVPRYAVDLDTFRTRHLVLFLVKNVLLSSVFFIEIVSLIRGSTIQ